MLMQCYQMKLWQWFVQELNPRSSSRTYGFWDFARRGDWSKGRWCKEGGAGELRATCQGVRGETIPLQEGRLYIWQSTGPGYVWQTGWTGMVGSANCSRLCHAVCMLGRVKISEAQLPVHNHKSVPLPLPHPPPTHPPRPWLPTFPSEVDHLLWSW